MTDGNGETHEYDTDIYMYRHTFIYSEPYTIIESPQDTVFVVDTEAYYPTTGTFRIKIEALNPVGKKGIDIYKSFNVKESDRKPPLHIRQQEWSLILPRIREPLF